VQRTPSIRPGKISRIFVTHCHGDHSFGLPGLLCLMGTDRSKDDAPVEIYGPEGLRVWLRVAIRYSVSRVVPPYRVHELMDVPMAPEWMEGHRKNGRFYYQTGGGGRGGGGADVRGEENGGGGGSGRGGGTDKKRTRWAMQGLAGSDPTSWISRAPMINLEVR
jgi:ribonuclease Z